ncbi:nitroreductase family protein [Bradyrhizobium sp. SZCCHNR1015]|uniref:nitroreductase family protein n=1 Tax=Bradyrhizobium sp. SZCCHNR1015 TaxID=3057338 RepID=UPI0029170FEF|nr:nitroreductase family protein [Bradyrhizobium sp. SZCCHNR1015]
MTAHRPPPTDRITEHPAHRIFVDRWSPRGFSDEALPETELLTFIEAARWAPASYNSQPWRFLYALRGSAEFDTFLAPLVEFNRGWAQHAAAIVYVLSKKTFIPAGKTEPTPTRTHSFDAGAAWANFANQAAVSGWVTHGMSGFDVAAAQTALGVPDGFAVEIAIAVGRKGDGDKLPAMLKEREKPSARLSIAEIASAGLFPQRFAG